MITVLFAVAVGLAAMAGGLFCIYIALLGRVPTFIGPVRARGEATATYWKGRLITLAAGPILIIVGGLMSYNRISLMAG